MTILIKCIKVSESLKVPLAENTVHQTAPCSKNHVTTFSMIS